MHAGEDLTFAESIQRHGGMRVSIGGCDAAGRARDACALAQGELAWIHGDAEDERRAQYHHQVDHYQVRDKLCRCLAGDHMGASLVECVGVVATGKEEL